MALVTALVVLSATASIDTVGMIAETPVSVGQHHVVVANTIGGMISYTRWPDDRPALRLCVVGATRYAAALTQVSATAGRRVTVQTMPVTDKLVGCDILYVGAMDIAARQRLMRAIRDLPVLSIAETDPDCRSGAIFCLSVRPDRVGFRLNIDAVSRSAVRVDPRVLRVAIPDGAER